MCKNFRLQHYLCVMIFPITVYGDRVLRNVSEEILKGSDVSALIADMNETMYAANGVGLAAPQIGKNVRLFVTDASSLEDEPHLKDFKKTFINPFILEKSGEPVSIEEGCLSIPGIREKVVRPSRLRIRYFDEKWNEREEEYVGFAARIIQHEYDHIEGILFTDYLSPLKKKLLQGKLSDISKGKVDIDYRIIPAKR